MSKPLILITNDDGFTAKGLADLIDAVKEFVEFAFGYAGLDWSKHVAQDPKYFRPNEVNELCADSSKSQKKLNWAPKIRFEEIVKIMVDADLESLGLKPIGEGREIIAANFGEWHL